MRLPDHSSELDSDFASTGYSIGDRAMLENALSTMMYKDPYLAVIREILANARDAHRELGIPQVAPLVTFPETGHANLIIQDFGPGINLERMLKHFTGYCASSKRDDNTQTGGFGLGCKTPYAISASFHVETVAYEPDGRKLRRLWSHHKDTTGLSAYAQLLEVETSDPTGTIITIPCSSSQTHVLQKHWRQICCWWEVPPVRMAHPGSWDEDQELEQIEPVKVVPLLQDGQVAYAPVSSNSHLVVVDGIPYNMPRDWGIRCRKNLVFYFKTGEVPVTLTRDNLDAKAEEVVLARYGEFLLKLVTEVKSIKEAISLSDTFQSRVPYIENGVVIFDGNLDFHTPKTYRIHRIHESKSGSGTVLRAIKVSMIDLRQLDEEEKLILWDGVDLSIELAKYHMRHVDWRGSYLIRPLRKRDRDLNFEASLVPHSILTSSLVEVKEKAPRLTKPQYWEADSGMRRLIALRHAPARAFYGFKTGGVRDLVDFGDGIGRELSKEPYEVLKQPVVYVNDPAHILPGWKTIMDGVKEVLQTVRESCKEIVYEFDSNSPEGYSPYQVFSGLYRAKRFLTDPSSHPLLPLLELRAATQFKEHDLGVLETVSEFLRCPQPVYVSSCTLLPKSLLRYCHNTPSDADAVCKLWCPELEASLDRFYAALDLRLTQEAEARKLKEEHLEAEALAKTAQEEAEAAANLLLESARALAETEALLDEVDCTAAA